MKSRAPEFDHRRAVPARVKEIFKKIERDLAREHSNEELAAAEAACKGPVRDVQAELQFAPHGRG